ncbi:lamin tail domain-containing protein [Candidatus Peregrinibacteria bacterium]|nr:lamin tail domain-containing protein [Candidatus Peregrinibacteria bacterium]
MRLKIMDMPKNRFSLRNAHTSCEHFESATKPYQVQIRRGAMKNVQPKCAHYSRKDVFRHVLITILFIAACGSIVFSPPAGFSQTAPPQIIINEIGALEPSETEWIEIYNKDSAAVDLNGWKFFEDQTNHGLTLFRANEGTSSPLIEAGQYAIIANKAEEFAQKYPNYSGAIFDSSWGSLKEDGEEIGLKNSAGDFIELFTYPAITGNNVSLERIDFNTTAFEPTNWTVNTSGNSIGKPNENALPAQLQLPADMEPAQPQSDNSALQPAAAETQPTQNSPAQPSSNSPPAPPAPLSGAPQTIVITQNPPSSPPKAIIQIQSGELMARNSTTVNFDGRASFDPDGDSITFLWDMGDGDKETTANPPPHKYDKPGAYTVTLTVTDSNGVQNQTQQYVQVVKTAAAAAAEKNPNFYIVPQIVQNSAAANLKSAGAENSSGFSFEIRGWLTLVPAGTANTAAKSAGNFAKKSAPAAKTQVKSAAKKNGDKASAKTSAKSAVKKSKKQPKKITYKNGDLSDAIKITEIFPVPETGNEEWIEIFNSGDKAAGLGNWTLADSAKKSSGFRITDQLTLQPGEYAVFTKSQTKISLNNDRDEIFLKDFKGNEIDNVKYESPQQNNSYALININETQSLTPNLVAAAQALPARNNVWEWTDELSPGKPNPTFEKINGLVSRLIAGGGPAEKHLFEITLPNGEGKIINFDEKILDPLVAEVVLREGSALSAQIKKNQDGTYDLKKIEEVRPAMQEKKEKSYIAWIIIGVIAASILLNGIPLAKELYRRIKEKPQA